MAECTTNNGLKEQESPKDNSENQKMEIEITRYKKIVEAFNSPKALAKLIIVISLIIVLVFFGISVIALVVKSYYPYKKVNSNEYGATIVQNEDNEVIYWLFNTADLWANSGIHVKKGDIISVRASGAFHSSIHHLVDDAKKNKMEYKWVSPTGGLHTSDSKDDNRSEYRISTIYPFNELLMQVIPEGVELKDDDGNWITEYDYFLDGKKRECKNNSRTMNYKSSIYPDIYAIGAERDKVTIRSNGVLHFAVNDIALTRDIILQMIEKVNINFVDSNYKDTGPLSLGKFPIPSIKDTNLLNRDTCDLLRGLRRIGFKGDSTNTLNFEYKYLGKRDLNEDYRMLYEKIENFSAKDTSYLKETFSELDYYLIRNFVDAWFVDNTGSYLIVIERKKQ